VPVAGTQGSDMCQPLKNVLCVFAQIYVIYKIGAAAAVDRSALFAVKTFPLNFNWKLMKTPNTILKKSHKGFSRQARYQ